MPHPTPPTLTTVALDPGSTTGVAIFYGDVLVRTFATTAPHEGLREELEATNPDRVVCEKGPVHRRQPEACAPVERLVIELFDNIHWLRPTDWKPSPRSRLRAEDKRPFTKHERDAAGIGRFWLSRTGGKHGKSEAPRAGTYTGRFSAAT